MTSWLLWDISDNTSDNPLKMPAEFEFNLEFEYDPGEISIATSVFDYFDSADNADCPPSVKVIRAACRTIKTADERLRVPTAHELDMLEDWFLTLLDKNKNLRQQIQEYGLDQMCVEPCDNRVDD